MADKYYRLVTFVVNICPKPLRELFMSKAKGDTNHHFTNLDDYLLFRKPDIDNLRRRFKISLDQFANIYPAAGSADVQTWDVSLLTLLLTQLFPNQLQQNERDCLRDITEIRNSLQHIASTEVIDDQMFNTSWSGLRDAVLTLSKFTGTSSLNNIEHEIKSALTENMPNLGDVLRTWHKVLYVQLQLQNSELVNEIKSLREESRTSSKILTKASVKRKGRSGIAEKRMKIVDNEIERMRVKLARSLTVENDSKVSFRNDISLISQQLTDNHRVVVTGHDNSLTYKCALAAIQEKYCQRPDQCLEINNPSDWKRICPEDAEFVLFREPFGRAAYDPQKVEVMLEEFDNMLDATNEDNEDVIDIIIVTNQRLLNEVTRRHEHDMLSPASTVYIDSTPDNSPNGNSAQEDTVHKNLQDVSKIYKRRHALKTADKHTKEMAEKLFLEHNTVTIVGPTGSGKTSLSFQLLSSYDLSNGEENFFVIMEPGELKYVKFSLRPVIIIKSLVGIDFDKGKACEWYRQFDRLFAAVKDNTVAVITTIETEVFRMWQANMPTHPLLDHVMYMPDTSAMETEKHKESVDCGIQTEKESHHDDQEHYETQNSVSRIKDCQMRSVKAIREYDIGQKEQRQHSTRNCCCVLPTGEILLAEFYSKKLKKLDIYYNLVSTCDLPGYPKDVCYTENNTAFVTLDAFKRRIIVIIKNMTLIKSVMSCYECCSVACHGIQLYVADDDSIYMYTTDGEYQKVLYSVDKEDYHSDRYFCSIAVSNCGGMIYIRDSLNKLITIDSSGNHLFTLTDIPDGTKRHSCVCVDDKGYVYLTCYNGVQFEIMRVSSDGRQNLGTVFELDGTPLSIQFDSGRSALLVVGCSEKLRVLTLR